jgi:S1-C subfamily serine protease
MGLACALAVAAAVPAGVGAAEKPKHREVRVRIGSGGALGLSLEDVRAEDVSRLRLAEEKGALVREVAPDSPAAEAGLQKDDVIVGFQGEPVHSAPQLARMVRETPDGRKVSLEVSRGGQVLKVTATVPEGSRSEWSGEWSHDFDFDVPVPAIAFKAPRPPKPPRPPAAPEDLGDFPFFGEFGRELEIWSKRPRLGLSYQELGDQLAAYFKVDGGLLVTSVNDGSPAAAAGIKAGDVIVRLNGKDVQSGEDFRDELGRLESGSEVTVGLQRDGQGLEVKAKLAQRAPRKVRRTIRS